MKTITLYILGLILISACRQVDNKRAIVTQRDSVKSSDVTELSNEIKIDSDLKPDFIVPLKLFGFGGGGYFTFDTTEIARRKYIFLTSLNEDSAVIKIKGKEIYLLPDSINSKKRNKDFYQEAWRGNGLSIILKITISNESGDEVNGKGTMEIINSTSKVKYNVHGGWEN